MRRLFKAIATSMASWKPGHRSRNISDLIGAIHSRTIDAARSRRESVLGFSSPSRSGDHRDTSLTAPSLTAADTGPQQSQCFRYRSSQRCRTRTGPAADLTFLSLLADCRIKATPTISTVQLLRQRPAETIGELTVEHICQPEVNSHPTRTWAHVNVKS